MFLTVCKFVQIFIVISSHCEIVASKSFFFQKIVDFNFLMGDLHQPPVIQQVEILEVCNQ